METGNTVKVKSKAQYTYTGDKQNDQYRKKTFSKNVQHALTFRKCIKGSKVFTVS